MLYNQYFRSILSKRNYHSHTKLCQSVTEIRGLHNFIAFYLQEFRRLKQQLVRNSHISSLAKMSYYDYTKHFTIHFTEYRAAGIFKTNWTILQIFCSVTIIRTLVHTNYTATIIFFFSRFRRSFWVTPYNNVLVIGKLSTSRWALT